MRAALAGCLAEAGVDVAARAARAARMPYMKIARRPIATPASTFSLVASSTKPRGATMRSCPRRRRSGEHAVDAAEVVDVAVREDHGDDRRGAEVLARERERGGAVSRS